MHEDVHNVKKRQYFHIVSEKEMMSLKIVLC